MGALLGSVIGVLLGGFGGMRAGLRGRDLVKFVGRNVITSGGSFGFFLSIGTAIRSC